MKKIPYNKLIRDRIPEIIEQDGKPYEVEVMADDAYRQALLTKLVEEAREAQEAAGESEGELAKELADVYEVVDAIVAAFALDEARVRDLQARRRAGRGGFAKRLKLLWVGEG